MKASRHVLAALPLAAALVAVGRPVPEALVAAASSVLIDVDHVADYVLCRGGWRGLGDFFRSCNEGRLNRLYLVLHSWELIILGGLAAVAAGSAACGMIVTGMAWHLACDAYGNKSVVRPGFYWFFRRAAVRFDAVRLYRDPSKVYA
jgi:hypothetical protein